MIIKTKWSSGGGKAAKNLANYIERGMDKNKSYGYLYYGFQKMEQENMGEYVEYAERAKVKASEKNRNYKNYRNFASVRHIIIAPERRIDERRLHYNVLKIMSEWRKESKNYGIRYVWGMHFNTEHPHAHIAMVSSYPEDIVMERENLREFKRIAERVFGEEVKKEEEIKGTSISKEVEKELHEAEMENEMEMGD